MEHKMTEQISLTSDQEQQLIRLKQYFPYRIVFGVIVDGEFQMYADTTKRRMNKFLKSGCLVFSFQ
jgi:hypothetical protein